MSQSTTNTIDIDKCSNSFNNVTWNVIQKYFEDNPQVLVQHHTDSYNAFVDRGIKNIIDNSPFNRFEISPQMKGQETGNKSNPKMTVTFGEDYTVNDIVSKGIQYRRPIIHSTDAVVSKDNVDNTDRYLYPNECRLMNKTYEMDVKMNVTIKLEGPSKEADAGNNQNNEGIERSFEIPLCSIPIMVQSNKCILSGMSKLERYNMGECRNDYGGYFIINGKEKTIVSQEEFGNNMLRVYKDKTKLSPYSYLADIRTAGEDTAMLPRRLSVRIVAPDAKFTNNNIVVDVPNLHRPIPLFILFRALGIVSDKDIIEMCLLDLETNSDMIELFRPSIQDTTVICKTHPREKTPQAKCRSCKKDNKNNENVKYNYVLTQCDAIEYMSQFVKNRKDFNVIECLNEYFLPNIGGNNYIEKAMFLGYMVYNLLAVSSGIQNETDRDSYKFKRVKTSGTLLYGLFTEYFKVYSLKVKADLDKFLRQTEKNTIEDILKDIISNKNKYFPSYNDMNTGIKKAFKGRWGATNYTREGKKGVIQDVKRLSYNSFMSHMRKVVTPMDDSTKIVKPHLLHNSQYGLIDPLDTPDGSKIGLHKYLALGAHITESFTKENNKMFIDEILIKLLQMIPLKKLRPAIVKNNTKVFLNGSWIGIFSNNSEESETKHPNVIMGILRKMRLSGTFSPYVSISWNIQKNQIIIFTDAGRLTRPVFTVQGNKVGYTTRLSDIESNNFTWNDMLYGTGNSAPNENGGLKTVTTTEEISEKSIGSIAYIDTTEEETAMIANYKEQMETKKKYTHLEIHPSLMLGYMGNQIIFPENNQLPRNLFSCGQSQQAVSLYNTNYFSRMDKMAVLLNYGQVPLIKSRYTRLMNNEEHPYGENAIVAIMVYGGYNVEDSILFNEGAVKRGLFRTTYLSMYESKETTDTITSSQLDETYGSNENNDEESENGNDVGNGDGNDDDDDDNDSPYPKQQKLENGTNITFSQGGNDKLGKYGVVEVNTKVNDKTPLIGTESWISGDEDNKHVSFVKPKKGQLGYVDKTYITNATKGSRIAKVSIREERVPAIGDKFCSRCGQKGTIGQIIPEEDMPFTSDGIKPDLIINPHALPSRMTIGQMIESVMGKACLQSGGYGDCTAFINKDSSPYSDFGNILPKYGYHSHGSEILYNGMSGKQLEADIYIGPTYYMRLKHMVKDKINFRAKGERTNLTRQTTKGRANDGGLRIGEMERDGMIGYGASMFLQESMLSRGDEYYMAICNNTGSIAIYNHVKNIYISPLCDGPIEFVDPPKPNVNSKYVSADSSGVDMKRIKKGRIYGKSFSIIKVPYAFKLLMQELHTMNVQMKIITEDNIDQLTNVSFSKNKLENFDFSGKDEIIRNPVEQNKQAIAEDAADEEAIAEDTANKENVINEDFLEQEENVINDVLNNGENEEGIDSIPDSPPYAPDLSSIPDSPPYAPDSSSIEGGSPSTIRRARHFADSAPEYGRGVGGGRGGRLVSARAGAEPGLVGRGSDSAEIPPPPPPYDDSSDSSAIPNVIKVDSNVILMKPGNQKQDIYSTNLAEKEKELQLELDILDTKQKIAALNNDSNRSDSISSMNDEISIQPRVSKRNDGIELLIDSSEEPKSDDYRTNNNDTSDKLRDDKKSEDDNNSSNSNTKQIRI